MNSRDDKIDKIKGEKDFKSGGLDTERAGSSHLQEGISQEKTKKRKAKDESPTLPVESFKWIRAFDKNTDDKKIELIQKIIQFDEIDETNKLTNSCKYLLEYTFIVSLVNKVGLIANIKQTQLFKEKLNPAIDNLPQSSTKTTWRSALIGEADKIILSDEVTIKNYVQLHHKKSLLDVIDAMPYVKNALLNWKANKLHLAMYNYLTQFKEIDFLAKAKQENSNFLPRKKTKINTLPTEVKDYFEVTNKLLADKIVESKEENTGETARKADTLVMKNEQELTKTIKEAFAQAFPNKAIININLTDNLVCTIQKSKPNMFSLQKLTLMPGYEDIFIQLLKEIFTETNIMEIKASFEANSKKEENNTESPQTNAIQFNMKNQFYAILKQITISDPLTKEHDDKGTLFYRLYSIVLLQVIRNTYESNIPDLISDEKVVKSITNYLKYKLPDGDIARIKEVIVSAQGDTKTLEDLRAKNLHPIFGPESLSVDYGSNAAKKHMTIVRYKGRRADTLDPTKTAEKILADDGCLHTIITQAAIETQKKINAQTAKKDGKGQKLTSMSIKLVMRQLERNSTCSAFQPIVLQAAILYLQQFDIPVKFDSLLNYFAGWGDRALAAWLSGFKQCIDVDTHNAVLVEAQKMICELRELLGKEIAKLEEEIKKLGEKKTVALQEKKKLFNQLTDLINREFKHISLNQPFETVTREDITKKGASQTLSDVAIGSPPFYNEEIYPDAASLEYDDFINKLYIPSVINIFLLLQVGGIGIIHLPSKDRPSTKKLRLDMETPFEYVLGILNQHGFNIKLVGYAYYGGGASIKISPEKRDKNLERLYMCIKKPVEPSLTREPSLAELLETKKYHYTIKSSAKKGLSEKKKRKQIIGQEEPLPVVMQEEQLSLATKEEPLPQIVLGLFRTQAGGDSYQGPSAEKEKKEQIAEQAEPLPPEQTELLPVAMQGQLPRIVLGLFGTQNGISSNVVTSGNLKVANNTK